ncbi:MAG: hypothetical protein ABI718_02625 [Acidobacteriota bacterium]
MLLIAIIRLVTRPRKLSIRKRLLRAVRKHQTALAALLLFHFVFFFPMLFMGRVLSPNDILYNYTPWSIGASLQSQNGTFNDIPTSYLTLMTMMQRDPAAFHWNRFIASGVPGFGSAGAAVLSPFVLLPVLLLPLILVYSGIVFLKLNVGFLFAYLWLREERMGKRPAAIGAMVASGAGIIAIWWLWPLTNAAALYPALLFVVSRMVRRGRVSFLLATAIGASFALSGFPATIAYGAYLGTAWCLFLLVRLRTLPLRAIGKLLLAILLAASLASPSVVSFARFLMRTGYLQARAEASTSGTYPVAELANFTQPFRLGDPVSHAWFGDPRLGASNNFQETTLFLGLLPLLLAAAGLFRRRAAARWFFGVFIVLLLLAMFGWAPLAAVAGRLPGIKYSPLARLRFLLPPAAAYLAAGGTALVLRQIAKWGFQRRFIQVTAWILALLVAGELAGFDAYVYPYIETKQATVPAGETIRYLQRERPPFRIAPFFSYLIPNTSEMYGLEDIRSHFSSEHLYRQMLARIDPGSFGGSGTILEFNGLRFHSDDPFLRMLNVRYLIEPPAIDIVRWSIYGATRPAGPDRGALPMAAGQAMQRQIDVTSDDIFAIELVFDVRQVRGADPGVLLSLIRPETGKAVYRRKLTVDELRQPKVYVPIRPFAARGNSLLLQVRSRGVDAGLLRTDALPGDDPISYAVVSTPFILSRELSDGRLFENVDFIERYHSVWQTRTMTEAAFLSDRSIDYGSEAVLFQNPPVMVRDLKGVPVLERRVELTLMQYGGRSDVLHSSSRVPFLLVSSEKLNSELTIEIDGRRQTPILVNGLFAAVPVQRGEHEVRFRRTLGRGFWVPSGIALLVLVGVLVLQAFRAARKSLLPARHDDDLIGEQGLPQLRDSYQQPL